MELNQSTILQLLGYFMGRGGNPTQNWMKYGGVNNRADTVISRGRQFIKQVAGQVPVFGPLIGQVAADYLVGTDFSRGVLHNTLSALVAPTAGTYAGNFQNLWHQQVISSLKSNRDKMQKDLRKAFLRNYYKVTGAPENQIDNLVEANNPISLPSVLNYLLDPAENQRTLQNIKGAQTGALSWIQRQNSRWYLGLGGIGPDGKGYTYAGMPVTPKLMAQELGERIKGMVMQANQYAINYNGEENHFGGFTGAQISQLANILSNASNQLDPRQLKTSLDAFQNTVKETARALSPLKDIFGRDMKAMTDMLQSVTGQNISQLPPAMIRSLSSNIVDMSRYSGATVVQMAQAGNTIMSLSARMGGNSFSRIGANSSGALYSGLIAQGNAPAGIHAAEYAAQTQHALASAQASQGVDWTAMAYAVWANKTKETDKSIQAFLGKVSQYRNNNPGGNMMDALVSVAKVSSQAQLLTGKTYAQYRTALQNPNLAMLGVQQQYRENLRDVIFGLAQRNENVGSEMYAGLQAALQDKGNAAQILQLVTNADNPQAVKNFVTKMRARGIVTSQEAVNTYLNQQGMLAYTARWASRQNMKAYLAAQAQLRKELEPLQGGNAGGLFTLFRALSSYGGMKLQGDKLKIKFGKDKEISLSSMAVQYLTQGVLGITKPEEVSTRMANLNKIFGEARAATLLTDASSKVGKDPEYVNALQTLAELGQYDTKWDADKKARWEQALAIVHLAGTGVNVSKLENDAAKTARDNAFSNFRTVVGKKNITEEERKEAEKKLKEDLSYAARIQRAHKLGIDSFGTSSEKETDRQKKRDDFIAIMEATGGKEVTSQKQLDDIIKSKKLTSNITLQDVQRAYAETGTGYNLQNETLKLLKAVLEQFLNWIRSDKRTSYHGHGF